MKIIKNNLVNKALLFEGQEENTLRHIEINLSINQSVNLHLQFDKNDIQHLNKLLDKMSFETIISECKLHKSDLLGIYKNTENLKAYHFIVDSYLVIISYGEFQYGLYKMYLEGIWELLFQHHGYMDNTNR